MSLPIKPWASFRRQAVPNGRSHALEAAARKDQIVEHASSLAQAVNTFLLVLAAIFPVVNPPGTALVFLALTQGAAPELRRELARRVAGNALVVLVCSLLCGALILQFYGISIPVLRLAGGYVVAVAGWRLLHEGSQKGAERADDQALRTSLLRQAFYPLTLPLTTGPGTIAVVISLGLSHPAFADRADQIIFLVASLLESNSKLILIARAVG